MEELKNKLDELCFNVDTINMLKNDKVSNKEICKMFEELNYPNNLTNSLSILNKSFIRSLGIRIKLNLKRKTNINSVKQDILKYNNTNVLPILNKLLDLKNEIETKKKAAPVKKKEKKVEEKLEVKEEVVEEEEEEQEEEQVEEQEEEQEEVVEQNSKEEDSNLVVDEMLNELDSDEDEEDDNEDLLDLFNKEFVSKGKKDSFLKFSNIYGAMKDWYDSNSFEKDLPDKKEAKEYFKDLYGKTTKGGWNGIKLNKQEDTDED